MANYNKTILAGHLTRDPEIRFSNNGTPVGSFGLAVNSGFGDNKEVLFIDVTVFGKSAEACGEYLRKGSAALFEGRLKLEQWEKDGQKRSAIKVIAGNVQFLAGKEANVDADDERGHASTLPPGPVRSNAKESLPGDDMDDLPF